MYEIQPEIEIQLVILGHKLDTALEILHSEQAH